MSEMQHFVQGAISPFERSLRDLMRDAKQCLWSKSASTETVKTIVRRLERFAYEAEKAGFALSAQELDNMAARLERLILAGRKMP